jgi:hypothetical protein
MEEDLSDSDGDDKEMKEAKSDKKSSKPASKGTIAKSKMANKRKQKDAIKLNKLRRQKGTQSQPAAAKQ